MYNFDRKRFVFSTEFEEDKDSLNFNSLGPEIVYATGGQEKE